MEETIDVGYQYEIRGYYDSLQFKDRKETNIEIYLVEIENRYLTMIENLGDIFNINAAKGKGVEVIRGVERHK